jgi:molybdate transport system substrate-binding protein
MLKRLLFVLTLLLTVAADAQELKVAAASDLTAALAELTAAYQKGHKTNLVLSFGSSGNFFTQIQNGAPFDIFFSADISYPQKLEEANLAEPGSLYEYAVGRLVLWVPSESSVDVNKGLDSLRSPAVRRVSIANPQHAPYGRAAVAALQHAKMYDSLKDKLVFGENISQAAQFVQSGNADVGFIALSLALSMQMKQAGKYWLVPADYHPPLRQAAVIVRSSRQKVEATKFLDFVRSAQGRAIMEHYGFTLPDQSKK